MITSSILFFALAQVKPVKQAPAVFADAQVRKTVEASRGAFSRLARTGLVITSGGESKSYAFSNGRLAGFQRGAQWLYENKTLTLLCSKGLFKGRMGPYNVNAWLIRAGANPEILPIQLVAKKNPIDVLVSPGSRVRKAGAMNEGGVWTDLVEIKSNRLRVSMGIRRDNHLLEQLSAVNVDSNGSTLFSTERRFKWTQVDARLFKFGAGKTPRNIRELK